MATESDPVIVRIIASQRDLEKSLASSVRATERAAAKMEKNLSGVGVSAGKGFAKFGQDAAKGTQQASQAAGQLSFQLNDIATSLSGGASPFQVMMQQGSQVAQVMQGIRAQGGSMGSVVAGAFASMLNPISLVSFGLIALTGYALQYFTATEEGGKDAEKTLQKQRDLIRDVATKWGEVLPGVKAYNDELERLEENAKKIEAVRAALAATKQELAGPVTGEGGIAPELEKIINTFARFPKFRDDIEAWNKAWDEFKKKVAAGNVTMAETNAIAEQTNALLNKLPVKKADELGEAFRTKVLAVFDALIDRVGTLNDDLARVTDTVAAAVNKIPLPSIGPPVTGGAGVFNPSQTQLEQAKKAREDAERAAEAAARELERATKENAQKAEQAAREAAEQLNDAIVNQTKVAVDAVTGLLGKSETANAAEINAFLKAGGIDLDAATQAWCAAFVNSALAQVGIKGTGSNVATSFLNWGQAVQAGEIRRGDVLVEGRGRGAGQTGGHVGFATGNLRATADGIAQIEMISGNASDKVQTDWVNATEVIARRATDAFKLPADALNHLSEESKRVSEEAKRAAQERAQAMAQFAQAITQMAQSAIGGLVNDLRNGVEAGEAFNNMLNRIIDSLLQMALQSMFSSQGLGGIFSTLLGGAAVKHKGGVVGAGGSPMRMVPRDTFVGAKRYAKGGFAGVAPGEVPIIAHRGELIIPKNMMSRMPASAAGGETHITDNSRIRIDMGSGTVAADSASAKQFGQNIKKLIQDEMVRESRPGGLLRRVPA